MGPPTRKEKINQTVALKLTSPSSSLICFQNILRLQRDIYCWALVWHSVLAKCFLISSLTISQNASGEMFTLSQRLGNWAQRDQKTTSKVMWQIISLTTKCLSPWRWPWCVTAHCTGKSMTHRGLSNRFFFLDHSQKPNDDYFKCLWNVLTF